MALWIVLLCTAIAQTLLLRRLRFDWFVVAMALVGTVAYVDYLTYTSITERNYDGASHVEYILWIAEHWRLPNVLSCGVCGHPPLYYALAALWSKVVLVGGWIPFELGLAWLSLLLFVGFIAISLLIFRSCTTRTATFRVAAALVIFWPSSIINSIRVHNDALASFLMLAALYFIAEWDRRGRSRDFYAALAASALALLTKSSGYAVATTLVFFAGLRAFSTKFGRESLVKCATAVLVLATTAVSAVAFRESRPSPGLCQRVLGNACYGRYVPSVPDTLSTFVSFNPGDFVRRVDTVPGDPFLNRFAKSSLFGVAPLGEEFGGSQHRTLAVLISVLLLAMVVAGIAAAPWMREVWSSKFRVYTGATVILFVFLVGFRVWVPNEFHEDFRHIFPALVPLCLGYATAVERLGHRAKVLYGVGVTIAVLMVALSVAFFARIP